MAQPDAYQQSRALLGRSRELGYSSMPTDATAQADVYAKLYIGEQIGKLAAQLAMIARAVAR